MKKLHLAALRHFFDKAVERHAIMLNPALSVRGPKLSVREGKTKGLGVNKPGSLARSTRHRVAELPKRLAIPKGVQEAAV